MGLPEWCQTHSLLDFMKLMEDSSLGHLDPTKERNMNDNLTVTEGNANTVAIDNLVKPYRLTDEEVNKLLATKPIDGESPIAYIVDAEAEEINDGQTYDGETVH